MYQLQHGMRVTQWHAMCHKPAYVLRRSAALLLLNFLVTCHAETLVMFRNCMHCVSCHAVSLITLCALSCLLTCQAEMHSLGSP